MWRTQLRGEQITTVPIPAWKHQINKRIKALQRWVLSGNQSDLVNLHKTSDLSTCSTAKSFKLDAGNRLIWLFKPYIAIGLALTYYHHQQCEFEWCWEREVHPHRLSSAVQRSLPLVHGYRRLRLEYWCWILHCSGQMSVSASWQSSQARLGVPRRDTVTNQVKDISVVIVTIL